MDRVTRVRAELTEKKSFVRRAAEAGPPCATCHHKTLLGMCGNPAYAKQSFDPALGRLSESYEIEIGSARADDGLCGPEGLLWEDMPPIQALWRETKSFLEMHPWTAYGAVVGTWLLVTLWR